jgi:phosphatidylinositol alpha 1,6-mannosyltransferase
MRIAIVTESFAPAVNGVANSVSRVADHLVARGHHPLVIAPAPSLTERRGTVARPYPVVRVASVPLPRYRSFRLGVPSARLTDALIWHTPDLVHLASPFLVGARAAALARQNRFPSVAVYQTEVPAYLRHYRGLGWGEATAWKWLRTIHNGADRTLAPSTTAAADLNQHGIRNVWLWGRGVDVTHFHPSKRSGALRRQLAPNGEILVGYVGRVAGEKRLDLFRATSRLRGVRMVVIGDGPARREAERALPQAAFLGFHGGEHLARLYASLDVFVHAGPHETFCQSIQEAQASGVPVVAPAAGGPVDLVIPGVNGVLVPAGDEAALAAAVGSLVASAELRQAYALAGRAAVQGRGWAEVGDRLIEHYRSVLGDRAAPTPGLPVAA